MAVHTLEETTEMLRFIITHMATKEDLKDFVRKDDLVNFATKDDLKAFATKDDFLKLEKRMASKEDLAKLGQDLRDHTTRECAKLRGDFNLALRKEDEKVDQLVVTIERGGGISRAESQKIQHLGPFAKFV